MPRVPYAAETPRRRRTIANLQNGIRNAINTSSGQDRKLGVDPARLKWAMKTYGIDVESITLRPQRLPTGSDLWADYKLWRDGELLFRLKLVPWDDRAGARWHVKRHPDASWWRRPNAPAPTTLRAARNGESRRSAGRRATAMREGASQPAPMGFPPRPKLESLALCDH
jgi:hypothetical protein